MKKGLVMLSSLLLVAAMLILGTGCTSNSNEYQSFSAEGILQGKIMDAITGEAIGGDNLEMYLINGRDQARPDKLIKNTEDDLCGEYAFSAVPVGLEDEIEVKVVVINDGYQRFEAIVSITTEFAYNYADVNITNEMFSMIGNIYLYPLDSSPGDVTVRVLSPQGQPVDGATVLLQQNVSNNSAIADTGDRLAPAAGLYPSLMETSDADGMVTFTSDKLVLGGSYNVVVEALNFDNQELATTTSSNFTVGTSSLDRVVEMNAASNALFAVSASNELPQTITADGKLVITFNQPVLLDKTEFAVHLVDDGTGVLNSTTPAVSLSSDGKTLTLTPVFDTEPVSKGAYVYYDYYGDIILKNSQTEAETTNGWDMTLFNGGWTDVMNINTGSAVSGDVLMISH